MSKYIIASMLLGCLLLFSNCKKKEDPAPSTNIASGVVSNLSVVSTSYTPASLSSNTASSVSAQADPCQGVSDFAICQSNLIRAYMQFGKETVDFLSQIASLIGASLGQIPDSNSGTSVDGKISWNKTSGDVWSILMRGTGGDTLSYISINNGVYTLKFDMNKSEDTPINRQFETTVTYTGADNWSVDIFSFNGVCDALDPSDPSKVHIKISKAAGLWTGKAMLYFPRWKAPNTTVDCNTVGSTITMYTDFVGNDISTKAALYLIPSTESGDLSNIATFDIPDFCTNFGSACGGAGEPTAGALAAYPNNWCTTGAGVNPTWGDNCAANAPVSGASFSAGSNWTAPDDLVIKTVNMPASL